MLVFVAGGQVEILSGSNKGEQGVVAEVFREQSMVTVANTKVNRKAQKGTETQAGGLVNVPAKIHISKVNLVDPASGCVLLLHTGLAHLHLMAH